MPNEAVHQDAKITMSDFATIAQGETYEFVDDSPWPPQVRMRVLEVKDGWVRYKQLANGSEDRLIGEFDLRKTVPDFLSMYRKVAT